MTSESKKRRISKDEERDHVEIFDEKRDQLIKSLTCAICQAWYTPPILACKEGHAACESCVKSIKVKEGDSVVRCAVCRTEEYTTRARCLEDVCESMVTTCEYNCGSEVACLLASVHKLECEYRPMKCTFGCENKMLEMGEVEEHLMKMHLLKEIADYGDKMYFPTTVQLSQDDPTEGYFMMLANYILNTSSGLKIILTQMVYSTEVAYSVKMIGRKKYANEMNAMISIEGEHEDCKAAYKVPIYPASRMIDDWSMDPGAIIIPATTIIKYCPGNGPYKWMTSLSLHKKKKKPVSGY